MDFSFYKNTDYVLNQVHSKYYVRYGVLPNPLFLRINRVYCPLDLHPPWSEPSHRFVTIVTGSEKGNKMNR